MKIVFAGTPDFAVAPLKNIIENGYEVVGVITQQDKPQGRKAILTSPPVKMFALEKGIPVLQPEKIRDEIDGIKGLGGELLVTCAYGQILSREIIDICKHGIINIHGSLLPKYRGASPIQSAVINGEQTTGITIMQTEEGIDSGDILATFETPIGETETSADLFARLSLLGAKHICSTLDLIESGKIIPKKQDESQATVVKTIKKEDALIDFSKDATTVKNLINGMNPWPVAFTYFNGKKIKFFKAKAVDGVGQIGEVITADRRLTVACGKGAVDIFSLQEEGGKAMAVTAYLNGRKLKVGDLLGK